METHATILHYKTQSRFLHNVLGAKDRKNPGVAPDVDTIFRIASITKIFGGLMLFQAYEKVICVFESFFRVCEWVCECVR